MYLPELLPSSIDVDQEPRELTERSVSHLVHVLQVELLLDVLRNLQEPLRGQFLLQDSSPEDRVVTPLPLTDGERPLCGRLLEEQPVFLTNPPEVFLKRLRSLLPGERRQVAGRSTSPRV